MEPAEDPTCDGRRSHVLSSPDVPAPPADDGRRRELIRKFACYSAVSAVSVPVSQLVLWICFGVLDMAAVTSNVIAVACGALPSYALNRRWVWRKVGSHSISREVVPFWMYTFLGLALSTVFVAIADRVWGTNLSVAIASMSGFATLWISKFLLLEHVLFVERDVAEIS
jgi:putative flippase GtrA